MLVAASIALPCLLAPAWAEDAKAFATIDGAPITEEDLSLAAEDLGDTITRFPENQRQSVLLDIVINMRLLAKAARDAGLDDHETYKKRLAYLTERTLRDIYFTEELSKKVTEEELRKNYDDAIKRLEPPEEVKASHILVKTKEEADAVVKELGGGKDFAELAKEKSIDPAGKSSGGDLGYFTKDRMVPEFAEAAFSMEVGKISDPVQSQFGWHVIKVEDKRKQPPPPFEQVKDQVRQMVMREKLTETVQELKAKSKVEILVPETPETKPAETAPKN